MERRSLGRVLEIVFAVGDVHDIGGNVDEFPVSGGVVNYTVAVSFSPGASEIEFRKEPGSGIRFS